ncbi:MAG: hypothetical protein EA363_05655 [Balneolaceae bacterium]|nr:MAG: hypothetical protein EA363_05655 [Balneolaceae bacterium]
MTYHDQPYYKEFRDLLTRIQSGVNDLKEENQRLKEENLAFSSQLKELRGKLAEAGRQTDQQRTIEAVGSTEQDGATADRRQHSSATSPTSDLSLFDTLDDNGKRILRQQIIDLIERIDKHLDREGSAGPWK